MLIGLKQNDNFKPETKVPILKMTSNFNEVKVIILKQYRFKLGKKIEILLGFLLRKFCIFWYIFAWIGKYLIATFASETKFRY